MADWAAFAGVAGVVTLLVLLLARASESLVSGGAGDPDSGPANTTPEVDSADSEWGEFEPATVADDSGDSAEYEHRVVDRGPTLDAMSTGMVLLNVALTQGFFGLFLLGGVWYAQVPLSALGIAWPTPTQLALGVVLGAVLFVANQVAARAGRRFGLGGGEELREALAPDSVGGWLVLLFVVLPVVAGFEELLFRGALIGGLATGYGLSPWLLAVGSSLAFALGHGAQGRVGVVVTGLLGFVFAGVYILTGSLAVVVVAHYLVNALEFVVHEGLELSLVDG